MFNIQEKLHIFQCKLSIYADIFLCTYTAQVTCSSHSTLYGYLWDVVCENNA